MIHITDHDISLQNRIELGKLPLVNSAVTPLEPRKGENEESSEYCVLFADKSPEEEESHRTPDVLTKEDRGTSCLFPEADLADLSEGPEYSGDEHVDRGSGLLSKDDDNEGYAKGLQPNIYSLRQSSRPEKLHSYSKALVSRS